LRLGCHIIERYPELAERLVEQPLAERDRLGTAQTLEIVADRAACLGGHDEVDPRGIRHRPLRGDDLDCLPIAQDGAQWSEPAVYLGRDAAVADIGVYRIS